jgi:hypothetical protein
MKEQEFIEQEEGHTCGYVALHNWCVLSGVEVPDNLRDITKVDPRKGMLPHMVRRTMRDLGKLESDLFQGNPLELPESSFPCIALVDAGYSDPHWVVLECLNHSIFVIDGLDIESSTQLEYPVFLCVLPERLPYTVAGSLALLKALPAIARAYSRGYLGV